MLRNFCLLRYFKKEVKYKPHLLHEVCTEETRLLREWIEKYGGDFSKVCVGKSLTGERGLYLIKDAKEGETVLSVPKECLIKADVMLKLLFSLSLNLPKLLVLKKFRRVRKILSVTEQNIFAQHFVYCNLFGLQ